MYKTIKPNNEKDNNTVLLILVLVYQVVVRKSAVSGPNCPVGQQIITMDTSLTTWATGNIYILHVNKFDHSSNK